MAGHLAILALTGLLAGCSVTGQTFHTSGLDLIVIGRTTLPEAASDLGAQPVDTWAQADGSVLARWAYRATLATDAVYFRQELWLRFGPDGRFERVERSINVPFPYHPRSAPDPDGDAVLPAIPAIAPPALSGGPAA